MKTIPLTHGLEAQVSDEDYEFVSQYHWYANKSGNHYYAMSHGIKRMNGGPAALQRVIARKMDAGHDNVISFADHNTLNCTRENIVFCSHADAIRSQGISKRNTSGYRGVSRTGTKWRAYISVMGKRIHLGTYISSELAARAFDRAAVEHFGKFCTRNFQN